MPLTKQIIRTKSGVVHQRTVLCRTLKTHDEVAAILVLCHRMHGGRPANVTSLMSYALPSTSHPHLTFLIKLEFCFAAAEALEGEGILRIIANFSSLQIRQHKA